MSMSDKKKMLETGLSGLSIRRQCELLELNRSNIYYRPRLENAYNLLLMKLLDEEYTRHPTQGVIKMVKYLADLGHYVNHKRVRRLLRLMGWRYTPSVNIQVNRILSIKYILIC